MNFFLPQNSKIGTIFLPQKQQKQQKCMYQMNYLYFVLQPWDFWSWYSLNRDGQWIRDSEIKRQWPEIENQQSKADLCLHLLQFCEKNPQFSWNIFAIFAVIFFAAKKQKFFFFCAKQQTNLLAHPYYRICHFSIRWFICKVIMHTQILHILQIPTWAK